MALDPLTAGLDLVKTLSGIADKFIPDRAAAEKAKLEMEARVVDALNATNAQQAEVNKAEAASASLFVAGWRPFVGWVCGIGLSWSFVVGPVANWLLSACHWQGTLPTIQSDTLYQLITAMLGLAGARTLEKIQGVAAASAGTNTPAIEVRRATAAR